MNDVKNNPAKYVGYGITILSGTIVLRSIVNKNSSIDDINSTVNSPETWTCEYIRSKSAGYSNAKNITCADALKNANEVFELYQ